MTVKIITERASSLSYKFAGEQEIYLIPANIIIGDKTIKDDNDETATKFLRKLQTMEEIPSPAAISAGEMTEHFRKATQDTDQAIYISVTGKLSAFHRVGVKVAEKLKAEGKDIRVFDSETVVSMEGLYAYKASQLAKEGKSINEIMDFLENAKKEGLAEEYVVLETLKYLKKNGRIGKARALLANIFSFKPIITIKDGEIEPAGRIRTNEQGIDFLIGKIKEGLKRTGAKKVLIMYDYGLDTRFVQARVHPSIQKEFNMELVSYNQLSTAIACHSGPEAWGIGVFYEK